MHRSFRPVFRNPHLATLAGNFWRREIDAERFPGRRRVYKTGEATGILVVDHRPEGDPAGQILFLHGLEGSCEAGYIKSFAQDALVRGLGVHRSNMRTCGGTESLSETMYHSGLTSDTLHILQQIRQEQPGPLFLVGFSLGGNVALKLAGELGENSLLTGVCAVSTPLDLAACVRTLDRPSNQLYARRFLSRLKGRIRAKAKISPHLYTTEGLDAIRNVWEFDDKYTGPLFGFGNAETYYRTQSSQQYLSKIRTPALVVHSKDDPIVPAQVYDHQAFATNSFLELITTEHGGHLGFLSWEKPRFWLDGVALDWMERVMQAQGPGVAGRCAEQTTAR